MEKFFSQLQVSGGFNDHPLPLNAIYRMRMIIFGKNPGCIQSNMNTNFVKDEEFVVAGVLHETDAVHVDHIKGKVSLEVEELTSLIISSTTVPSRSQTSSSVIMEGCEEDDLKYLAGYIAKKFHSKFK